MKEELYKQIKQKLDGECMPGTVLYNMHFTHAHIKL